MVCSVFSRLDSANSLVLYTLPSHPQCNRVPVYPYPHQLLIYSIFTFSLLVVVQWCACVVFICICLISNDIKYLSFCFSLIEHLNTILFVKALFMFLPIFAKLGCLPFSFWSLETLYILDTRFLSGIYMNMCEQNPHILLISFKF